MAALLLGVMMTWAVPMQAKPKRRERYHRAFEPGCDLFATEIPLPTLFSIVEDKAGLF